MRAIDQYPMTEDEFIEEGGECRFCGNTEFSEHSSDCPVAADDFEEDDAEVVYTVDDLDLLQTRYDDACYEGDEDRAVRYLEKIERLEKIAEATRDENLRLATKAAAYDADWAENILANYR